MTTKNPTLLSQADHERAAFKVLIDTVKQVAYDESEEAQQPNFGRLLCMAALTAIRIIGEEHRLPGQDEVWEIINKRLDQIDDQKPRVVLQ